MTDSPEHDNPDRGKGGDPELARYLRAESPRRTKEPDALATLPNPADGPLDTPDSAAPDADMRDMQKSLVERIADVDDDRRRSAVQLRKALETHRDEIRAQRRRDHGAILVLAGIGIVLLAAVALLFSELLKARGDFDERLSALEQREAAPASAAADTDLGAELDELADAIEAIGDRLTSLEGSARQRDVAAAGSASAAEPADATRLEDLESRVGALLDERLAAVEARIDDLRAGQMIPAVDDDTGAADAAQEADRPPAETITTTDGTTVLQLAGLPNRNAIDRFIDRHRLPEQIYVKVDSLRGRTWYGIIHSLHPDMDSAEAARDALPAELARLDTWLRQLPAGTRLEVLEGEP